MAPWHAFRGPRGPILTWRDANPLIALLQQSAALGLFTRDEAQYMIAKIIQKHVDTRAEEDPLFVKDELCRVQILVQHGIEDEQDWDPEEQTAEYRRLARRWSARMMTASAAWLDELGEREMARLLRVDHHENAKRQLTGGRAFYGVPISKETEWNSPPVARPIVDDRLLQ